MFGGKWGGWCTGGGMSRDEVGGQGGGEGKCGEGGESTELGEVGGGGRTLCGGLIWGDEENEVCCVNLGEGGERSVLRQFGGVGGRRCVGPFGGWGRKYEVTVSFGGGVSVGCQVRGWRRGGCRACCRCYGVWAAVDTVVDLIDAMSQ